MPNNDISNVPNTMDFTVGSGKKATYHKKDMIFLSSTLRCRKAISRIDV
ncbi:hypothetical protein LRHMDP3_2014 [Lacticaseibacillus rhamnosus LRHMDP3]|uniref:Uncharacterized protein n=1 Tax=Lacticaseibacillus rhamnosus LRHMDP3 TaxID=1203259 RepID=A0AB33XSY2_LACRH|nr:hypothetical protein LRHMDP3_2014 [Lacticaseibacillus rhamnosus LRHMDP3]